MFVDINRSRNLSYSLQAQVHVCAPTIHTLYRNTTTEVFCVRSSKRQAVTQPSDTARIASTAGDRIQCVRVAVVCHGSLFVIESCEAVRPNVGKRFWRDASASITNSDSDALGSRVQWTNDAFGTIAVLRQAVLGEIVVCFCVD